MVTEAKAAAMIGDKDRFIFQFPPFSLETAIVTAL